MLEINKLLPESLENLICNLNKLPGIGSKTAQRLALSILKKKHSYIEDLNKCLQDVTLDIKYCKECQNLSDNDICKICEDQKRQTNKICVVEDILDLIAIENAEIFKGRYFVLHGLISPLNGVMPSDTKVDLLVKKLNTIEGDTEVILALNSTADGEATSHYINESLQNDHVSVTKLASGLPFGSDLDYADSKTLTQAIENRKSF